jgi:phage-related protein
MGGKHEKAKPLRGFGGAGVLEIVENEEGGAYRAVYTVRFAEAVFVLHCFQKKSKRGIATPKADMDLIRNRLKDAESLIQELRHANAQKIRG